MDSQKEKGTKKINVYLDRVEELEDGATSAVLLYEEEEDEFLDIILPGKFLPENSIEGDYLTITISRNEEKTESALNESRRLLKGTEG